MVNMNKIARSSIRRAKIFGIIFSSIFVLLTAISSVDLLIVPKTPDKLGIVESIIGKKQNLGDIFFLIIITLIGVSLTLAIILFGKRMIDGNGDSSEY
jgi:hypothetical protein